MRFYLLIKIREIGKFMLQHSIEIQFSDPTSLADLQDFIEKVALHVMQQFCANPAEVTIKITDEVESQYLNHTFRQKNSPTNVLSFPCDESFSAMEPSMCYLGDIILCEPITIKEAQEQGIAVEAHLAHLIIHGLLHLLGYDHLLDEEAEIMEGLEIRLMSELGYGNPYQNRIEEPL